MRKSLTIATLIGLVQICNAEVKDLGLKIGAYASEEAPTYPNWKGRQHFGQWQLIFNRSANNVQCIVEWVALAGITNSATKQWDFDLEGWHASTAYNNEIENLSCTITSRTAEVTITNPNQTCKWVAAYEPPADLDSRVISFEGQCQQTDRAADHPYLITTKYSAVKDPTGIAHDVALNGRLVLPAVKGKD